MMTLRIIGKFGDGNTKLLGGRREVSRLAQHQSQRSVSQCVLLRKLQGRAKLIAGSIHVPLESERESKVVVVFGTARLQINGLSQCVNGGIQITAISQNLAQGEPLSGLS